MKFYLFVLTLPLLFFSGKKTNLSTERAGDPTHLNVILILADDLGYEVPTVNGGQSYQTPTLDKMASEGRRFTQCHSSPLCSPSRFALLTGKYNFRNYFNWGKMGLDQKTIANMFHDAGYKTLAAGKWQLGGADEGLHTFGFDSYCLWNATGHGKEKGSRYKNPTLYVHGAIVPPEQTLNKYGEDIFCDTVLNFMERNKSNPFFIYYAMVNTHEPFSPTPDDKEFASWDPNQKPNTAFYPSMVKYADKKIKEIIDKVNQLGIANNTVIIYIGDNGCPKKIVSKWNGQQIAGGKGKITEAGTHVPCIIWGAKVARGVDSSLLCFQDFFPTLGDIANISSSNYGTLDGISFYPQIGGLKATPRSWIYNYYRPTEEGDSTLTQWAQNHNYKLELVGGAYTLRYVSTNAEVANPTPEQQTMRDSLASVITSMHAEKYFIPSKKGGRNKGDKAAKGAKGNKGNKGNKETEDDAD